MNTVGTHKYHDADICVIGGGMSGLCAAVAAARHGAKVVLMQDRPVLGGNASSENRMYIRGATSADLEYRETGILQEIELENIYRNPTMNFSVWDTVLYQAVLQEENITLLLNCSCMGCEMDEEKIASVTGWQLNSYTFHTVNAKIFMDCSGDSILSELSGAPCRVGREGQAEFDEYGAPETADRFTMGSSCLIQARETDHPCTFIAPEWAYKYPDDESMYLKNHDIIGTKVNFWWIELGGEMDTIHDAQTINEELIKTAYGVWDHIKNHGDHGMENWELEWIGFLPGKRESRRYEGAYILNQRDLEEGHHFEDTVAFGGWTMDNHSPKGFKYMGYSSRHIKPKVPYEIPFRCLYSVAVPNLMFAGRNISATHMAMSSTRIMATCSLLGQAAGTGAALAIGKNCLPADITKLHMAQLQEMLHNDGCYLPGLLRTVREDDFPELSDEEVAILRNGWERPHEGVPNTVSIPDGQRLVMKLRAPGKQLRLALDPDFSRKSITDDSRFAKFAMRSHLMLADKPLNMPANLLRGCEISIFTASGVVETVSVENNRAARLFFPLPAGAERIEITKLCSWGGEAVKFFACDII
ncbi:MAG: FAD-dependent oxidoreductase [Oscillospiraceae bacterium]|nr:FAD-dependent oxidoreductase [Oscillospiraceae bacterium]